MLQYIELTLKNLAYQKMRAVLTLLGVIIGITAVVAMVSIGAGMSIAVEEQFEAFGTNKIIVTATQQLGTTGQGLTDSDVNAIEDVFGVEFVSPMYSVSTGTEFKGEEKVATVWGLDPDKAERTFSDVGGYNMYAGRWLQAGDRNVVVVGFQIHDDFYKTSIQSGNKLTIQGEEFRVVGIFKEVGDPDQDNVIMMDIDKLRELLDREDSVSGIIVRAKSGADVDIVALRIEERLKNRHEDAEFMVSTSQQLLEMIKEMTQVVQIVFGGIAGISLLVGGIGIANTMIMNVMERTPEIGIMKATGATNNQIMKIFLVESGIFGLIGGSIGVFFGYLISKAINVAAETYLGPNLLVTAVTNDMIIQALGFSLVVGVVSGVYPAYRAVKLDPVEALRG
ncbi:MAG: ABC transporter permease [Candidatus Hydrothermarchaeaceae archaeon]